MADAQREIMSAWEGWQAVPESFREIDHERVLVLNRYSGTGRASGMELDETRNRGATIFHIQGGKVTSLDVYWERDRALADLGLEE